MASQTPEVSWAQRSSGSDPEKNFLYVTIAAPDVPKSEMEIDLKPTEISFKGKSDTKKVTYEVIMELYAEIDPSLSHIKHSARDVEMKLRKKELNEEFWPRLLKDKKKAHYLRTNFDQWVDQDEQESKEDDDYLANFNSGNGTGGFEGLDFSKLGGGGAGGMPDMSELPTGGSDDEGEEEEDEEMPDLEDEKGTEKAETGSAAKPVAEATGDTGASATKTSGGPTIEEIE